MTVSKNTIFILDFVHYSHYFLFFSYIALRLSIRLKADKRAQEYVQLVDLFFKFCIGLLLIAMSFPVIFIDVAEPEYKDGIIRVMWIGGFIVLSTIKFNDVRFAIDTIESIYTKYS